MASSHILSGRWRRPLREEEDGSRGQRWLPQVEAENSNGSLGQLDEERRRMGSRLAMDGRSSPTHGTQRLPVPTSDGRGGGWITREAKENAREPTERNH
ncbi:hypothetical protein E2562_036907 [Oryza meyeriana var. granulata]|uniref:Uncharacterized protein n=1 Tax=Oryza meyeriana var. granulata TaxID=110450 RepID=A0A6G1ETH6_9ORYZ|nr:hypothetical protein E2562_036907 [Oryza meyeriana var. granulata]